MEDKMSKVISIRFKPDGKEYYFDPVDKKYNVGEMVVVTTSKGTECATVSKSNHEVPESLIVKPLCKVERRANENDLNIFQLLAAGQVLNDGAHVADFLSGVVVVGHAVQNGDGASASQVNNGLVLDNASHDDVDQLRQNLTGVTDGLVATQLDHAGSEVLSVAAHLAHSSLEGDAGTGGGLLEDHTQSLILHQRGIVAVLDALLDLQGQFDDVQQFLLGEITGVDKVTQLVVHNEFLQCNKYINFLGHGGLNDRHAVNKKGIWSVD